MLDFQAISWQQLYVVFWPMIPFELTLELSLNWINTWRIVFVNIYWTIFLLQFFYCFCLRNITKIGGFQSYKYECVKWNLIEKSKVTRVLWGANKITPIKHKLSNNFPLFIQVQYIFWMFAFLLLMSSVSDPKYLLQIYVNVHVIHHMTRPETINRPPPLKKKRVFKMQNPQRLKKWS